MDRKSHYITIKIRLIIKLVYVANVHKQKIKITLTQQQNKMK